MTNEEMRAIIDLGELVKTIGSMIVRIDEQVQRLERRMEQGEPRNEYGMNSTEIEFFQRWRHMLRHKDCPAKWTARWDDNSLTPLEVMSAGEVCKLFEREFVSFNFLDYVPVINALSKRVDALEFLMPSDIKATLREVADNDFNGVSL